MSTTPVTVVGATGKLGRHVVRLLQARGVPVIPVARSPEKLPAALQRAARRFDLEQPETYGPALAGTKILVSCVHGGYGTALMAALPAGVERIVLMGSTRIFSKVPDPNIARLQTTVAALAGSGIPGVMLHPTMIYGADGENNLQRVAAYIRRIGIVPLPDGGRTKLQPIHVEDVAACVDAALRRPEADGAPIVIAGASVLSYADLVRAVAAAIGRRVIILPIPIGLLELAALATPLLPFLPRIRRAEIRRLAEDKTFPTDAMRQRLGIEPLTIEEGLKRTFG